MHGPFAEHWPEYLMEGALLGTFMLVACVAVTVLEHPRSAVRAAVRSPLARRAITGVLMGTTAIALIYSPWGQRSGAHMNPATTLTFLALGKLDPVDAAWYIVAQCLGGVCGVSAAAGLVGSAIRHKSVDFARTVPSRGKAVAFAAEWGISFVMMTMVLVSNSSPATAPLTGMFAGALVALYITFEAPYSGMSLNPARTLASAVPARAFDGIWVYLTAPPLGMLSAAGMYVAALSPDRVQCAKLNHEGQARCIFRCGRGEPHRGNPAMRHGIEGTEK